MGLLNHIFILEANTVFFAAQFTSSDFLDCTQSIAKIFDSCIFCTYTSTRYCHI